MSARRPLVLEPAALIVSLLSALVAASLSMHLFFLFGVVPAVELLLVSALHGLWGLSRVLRRFLPEQALLLAQTAATTGSVAAALGLVLPISLATAAGYPNLASPLLLGSATVSAVALLTLGWLAGPTVAPTTATGSPSAEFQEPTSAVRRWFNLSCLALGLTAGFWAGLAFSAPLVAAFGLAFLGSGLGIGALAAGLLTRPTLPYLSSIGLTTPDLPSGALLGAGLVALPQLTILALLRLARARRSAPPAPLDPGADGPRSTVTVGLAPRERLARAALTLGLSIVAGMVALLAAELGPLEGGGWRTIGLALLVGLVVPVVQLWSGLVGAWTGLVPILGLAMVVLLVGASLRLDPDSLVLLVALGSAGGPLLGAFGAQRGNGSAGPGGSGRSQPMLAGLLGLAVALAVVAAGSGAYLQAGYLPPAAAALTVAVEASQGSLSWGALVPGLGLGALLQLLGGPMAQVGLLFSTGLLIDLEPAGWALLWGLLVRTLAALLTRGRAESPLAIFGVGCIGGEFLRLLTGGL